ncbi:SGNH/GDSL hydrolase family protein [Parabacteroides bouchesdurhonensis]|uniref:SGNH/GDSL hydrolase family protein n=1 Tax=Parabacteroides bouchesdurhonensis TaxID=1936995 RepID=UPI000E482D89|nr:SGNH/GDSL hydrolase family protein [Parabacteroides bouchesdurhonensis]RHJ90487.1 acetylhydrolase [Bacteroides sp. AM07-16]
MKHLCLLLFCLTFLPVQAQWQWYNPQKAEYPVIQNQGWPAEIGKTYVRLPNRAEPDLRKPVWELSRNSAGLAIRFYSNAPRIKVRYTVAGPLNMPHMPSTGVSGVDLYNIDNDGKWHFCFGGYSFSDTIQYSYDHIRKSPYHDLGYEYNLYLPLYNSVKWMEIGIPEGYKFQFIPQLPEKPILLYGTSVGQGACASRPAMAWTNIIQRSLDYPFINLGFSGNGRLENGVLQFVTEVDARLYILDCLANINGKTETELIRIIRNAVLQIRQKRSAPILLIDHSGCSNADTDSTMYKAYSTKNNIQRKAYEALISEGVKELYYLSHDELNLPSDGWVDYVHPSDLGMMALSRAIEKKIREILQLPVGQLSTTTPVTQRREPHNYEWKARHQDILALNKSNPPRAVILGNSITHFWGGEPVGPHRNGTDSWDKIMRKEGFHNMGYGFDRIENILWRVYHDELSGYDADRIVLMAGTNNIFINTEDEIVEGIRFLLSAIHRQQPKAKIKVIGILPRRGEEDKVRRINESIRRMVSEEGYIYCDAGLSLLQKDGKINESLFTDGLHPNAKGYWPIAPQIAFF